MNLLVHLRNASLAQGEHTILDDIHLTISRGEFAYLIGKTGSGKSSLLKLLYGDLTLERGEGEVCGFALRDLTWRTIPQLRKKLGIIFQDFNLLTDRSSSDNLKFVLEATGWTDKAHIQQRIDEALESVGLATKGFKMPYELSGGEQQRLMIARALLNDPELIIADEPTGNLDPDTADDILTLLWHLNKTRNAAILLATHDYRILERYPSRIIRCQNGRVLDEESFVV